MLRIFKCYIQVYIINDIQQPEYYGKLAVEQHVYGVSYHAVFVFSKVIGPCCY